MKIAMVTGSYPPDVCGVGDYTHRLVTELKELQCDIEIVTGYKWCISEFLMIRKSLLRDFDIIHIQYPTVGYGHSLIPQLLTMLPNVVITVHEVSQVHVLRKISLLPFFILSKNVIFTSEFELRYVKNKIKLIPFQSHIIPIGSNISSPKIPMIKNNHKIVYFGLIRKKKGIEQVIALSKKFKSLEKNMEIQIIGLVEKKMEKYFEHLKEETKNLPIEWLIGLPEKEVSLLLSRAEIAYLPYPDGASERRGSLLALLSNGVAVITTKGQFTSSDMYSSMLFTENIDEVLQCIECLIQNKNLKKQLVQQGLAYAKRFTWQQIALDHIKVYESLLKK